MTLPTFPLGDRGDRPVFFPTPDLPWERKRQLLALPGVTNAQGGLVTTWDYAWALAALLQQDAPTPPIPPGQETPRDLIAALPGLEEYKRLGLHEKLRDYQKLGAAFLAVRSYALIADEMRLGKTPTTISASVLAGGGKTLVLCPALPRLGWAEEIYKWTGHAPLILVGRRAMKARIFCPVCRGSGRTEEEAHCRACRKMNGQSDGFKLIDAMHGTCSKHKTACAECVSDLERAVERAEWIITSPELLLPQRATDRRGREIVREGLPGQLPMLGKLPFARLIVDEGHEWLRGDPIRDGREKQGRTIRDKMNMLAENIPQVWELTGTPQFGRVRHWWGQIDFLSRGAVVSDDRRLPFDFHTRYCEGGKSNEGHWVADGHSIYAETEWKERLRYFMIRREKKDVAMELPPKQRQMIRCDTELNVATMRRTMKGKGSPSSRTKKLMDASAKAKLPFVLENVMPELVEGSRLMIVCFSPDTVRLYARELAKTAKKRQWKQAMRGLQIWQAHGGVSPDARYALGKAFREHRGPGVFIMTIDAFQVGVSLSGAKSEHWIDVHHDPSANLQAENRAHEPGITHGLNLLYYYVPNSIDEHRLRAMLPKLRALDAVMDESAAADLASTFKESGAPKETLSESLARLAESIGLDDWDEEEDDFDE